MGQEKPWYWQPERLLEEIGKHGSVAAAARAHNVKPNTVTSAYNQLGLPPRPRGGGPAKPAVPLADMADPPSADEQSVLAALKTAGDEATVEDLADLADLSPRRVREALERLGHDGYRVETGATITLSRHPTETGRRHKASPALFDGDVLRFGVISDTHLGSKAERPDAIETAYEVLQAEGITTVYHVGDLVDGQDIYRNHNTEVSRHTYEEQVEWAAEIYPHRDSITTFLIGGNHDLEGAYGKAGADPVQAVCNRRDDMQYLGRYSAWVELPNGATMHLLHPQGGASYATSYRPQKIAESYEAGDKPNVLLIGHWHRMGYLFPRNIHILLAGTFQGPTTFSTRHAMGQAGWGFWLIEARMADDGSVVRFQPTWHPFFPGREIA